MHSLTRRNILDYLLDQHLVTPESVVDGNYMVVSASSRNRNFKVIRRGHTSYFVKQVERRIPESVASLTCEANLYSLAQSDSGFASLAASIPRFFLFDPQALILVVELYAEGETLTWTRWREKTLPVQLARTLGETMARYHDCPTHSTDRAVLRQFPQHAPWILSLHQNPASAYGAEISPANRQMLDILRRNPDFPKMLEDLRAEWRHDTLIHGDMKWENIVLVDPQAPNPELSLVDWELANLGDAAWDTGSILQAFLTDWVFSIQIPPGAQVHQLEQYADVPLDQSVPAIQAFWRAYAETRGLEGKRMEDALSRAARYGAARMVQTLYEHSYDGQRLDMHHICLLQLSLNILREPERAIEQLFNLKVLSSYETARV